MKPSGTTRRFTCTALTTALAVLLLSPALGLAEDDRASASAGDPMRVELTDAGPAMALDTSNSKPSPVIQEQLLLEVEDVNFSPVVEAGLDLTVPEASLNAKCFLLLCCGDEHCQPPYVSPGCAGYCDLSTATCVAQ